MATAKRLRLRLRLRVLVVAASLVLLLLLERGGVYNAQAFVLPSGLATHRSSFGEQQQHDEPQQNNRRVVWQPLRSFKFIKGETVYGDLTEGSTHSGMLGGQSAVGYGFGTNSLSRGRSKGNRVSAWWTSSAGFSRTTPTTLLAAGSVESWPVMEADDIQVLVRKGDDLENDSRQSHSSVSATLERWERDISLEVVGPDGFTMLGNEMQPSSGQYSNNGYNNNNNDDESGSGSGRCTQSIRFDVADGDVYPFSGTISVPPPLTVEDSMGNQQTVMMVLNNPDENQNDQQIQQYDDYGNEIRAPKPSSVEARLEPLYKSPDEKYAEAQQQQQQQQQLQYDEYGNELYDYDAQQQYGEEKTTIPSQGYQSFQLDATDPSTGKIKIDLERDDTGGGGGGAFGNIFGGGGNQESSSEARVEIYHGFRDQYGNSYNTNNNNNYDDDNDEEDRRISFEVSTMHPTFSSVVDTMPANLLAKHALPSVNDHDLSSVEPYLEVRIVNTGGAALKAGVKSFLPQYKPQNQREKERHQYERQKYEQRLRAVSLQQSHLGTSVKADDPFLLVDSAQSTTSSRRMNVNNVNFGTQERTYVRASSRNVAANNAAGPSIHQMWSTGDVNNDRRIPRPPQERYRGQMGHGDGMRADVPGASLLRDTFVQAESGYQTHQTPIIQSRISPEYYDVIDTVATPKGSRNGNTVLVPTNDFTKAHPKQSQHQIGSGSGSGYRRVGSSSTTLQSFGGNSGNASGMEQPFQQQRSQSQSFEGSFEGYTGGFEPANGLSQGLSQQQQQGRGQFASSINANSNTGGDRSSSAFAGNGNVIGNGVIAGRPADEFLGGVGTNGNGFQQTSNNAPRNNVAYGGRQASSSSFTPPPSNNFGQGSSNSNDDNAGGFGFGHENSNNFFMGESMNQQQQPEENDNSFSFSTGGFGKNNQQQQGQRNGGLMKNLFGGNNNRNQQQQGQEQDQGRMNNSFGGNNNNSNNNGNGNNNSGPFGGNNNNSQSPFGNLGKPPMTKANSKNPFATLNGENSPSNNNGDGSPFGSNGSGEAAPRTPMNNPFSGLNGNKNSQNNSWEGSATAMGSSNNPNGFGDYETTESEYNNNDNNNSNNNDNPIMGFAKSIVQGIGDYANR